MVLMHFIDDFLNTDGMVRRMFMAFHFPRPNEGRCRD